MRAQWTDEALKEAIQAIDDGYTMEEVSIHYSIPRTSLRDHISGKTTSRKMGPAPTLTKEEEEALIHYLEEMVDLGHPLNPSQLKTKVGGDDPIKINTIQARNSREFLAEVV